MNIGEIVMTIGIANLVETNFEFACEIPQILLQYVNKDWGNTSEYDAKLNNKALQTGDRIVAVYETSIGKVFIITEADRSYTTILLPSEY